MDATPALVKRHASATSGPAAPAGPSQKRTRLGVEMKLDYCALTGGTAPTWWFATDDHSNARMKNSAPVCCGEMI